MTHKNQKAGSTFDIHDELAALIDGMESSHWSTYISQSHVKTISVTFKVKPARTTCSTKC